MKFQTVVTTLQTLGRAKQGTLCRRAKGCALQGTGIRNSACLQSTGCFAHPEATFLRGWELRIPQGTQPVLGAKIARGIACENSTNRNWVGNEFVRGIANSALPAKRNLQFVRSNLCVLCKHLAFYAEFAPIRTQGVPKCEFTLAELACELVRIQQEPSKTFPKPQRMKVFFKKRRPLTSLASNRNPLMI